MNRERIDEIRENTDIVEVISRYVNLKQSGSSYKGICPFHEDSDPSLTVDPNKKLWYCFGCGAGGDIFKFLSEIEGLSFPEAAEELADELGMDLEDEKGSGETRRLKRLMKEVTTYYHQNLLREGVGREPRNYLLERGYPQRILKKFELGYSLPDWRSLTNRFRDSYGLETLRRAGLAARSDQGDPYDRFRGRIMFPIKSPTGKTIAYGGRRMKEDDKGPKYLNSPNTPLFQKGCTLYGLDLARTRITAEDRAVLVEGYTDAIALQGAGVENAVASLGTALTEKQVELLRRFAEEVIIAYDRDQAGEKATLKAMRLMRNQGLMVKVVDIPPDKDPAQLVEEEGIEAFKDLMEQSRPFHQFYAETLENRHDLNTVHGREKALQEGTDFLKDIESPPLRGELIKRIKDLLSVPEEEIEWRSTERPSFDPDSTPDVQLTQEDMSPDDWAIHLLFTERTTAEEMKESGVLEALKHPHRQIVEKYQSAEAEGSNFSQFVTDLNQECRELATELSLTESTSLSGSRQRTVQDVFQKIKSRERRQKRDKLKDKLKQKIANGADKAELEEIQNEILRQTKKLNREVDR